MLQLLALLAFQVMSAQAKTADCTSFEIAAPKIQPVVFDYKDLATRPPELVALFYRFTFCEDGGDYLCASH